MEITAYAQMTSSAEVEAALSLKTETTFATIALL